MKNIILFICVALLLWGCISYEEPNEEFSLKGTLVENCETGKPVAGVNMVLICRDYSGRGGKSDAIIPFKTNADGSFFVKGEPNYPYYFVTNGANQISSGVTFIEGMGPKNYDLGEITYKIQPNDYHTIVVKYDISNTTFKEGDTFKTYNEDYKYPLKNKYRLEEFYNPDSILIKKGGLNGYAHFPDPAYANSLIRNGFQTPIILPNFYYLGFINRKNNTETKVNYSYRLVFSCDKYPVVTVIIP